MAFGAINGFFLKRFYPISRNFINKRNVTRANLSSGLRLGSDAKLYRILGQKSLVGRKEQSDNIEKKKKDFNFCLNSISSKNLHTIYQDLGPRFPRDIPQIQSLSRNGQAILASDFINSISKIQDLSHRDAYELMKISYHWMSTWNGLGRPDIVLDVLDHSLRSGFAQVDPRLAFRAAVDILRDSNDLKMCIKIIEISRKYPHFNLSKNHFILPVLKILKRDFKAKNSINLSSIKYLTILALSPERTKSLGILNQLLYWNLCLGNTANVKPLLNQIRASDPDSQGRIYSDTVLVMLRESGGSRKLNTLWQLAVRWKSETAFDNEYVQRCLMCKLVQPDTEALSLSTLRKWKCRLRDKNIEIYAQVYQNMLDSMSSLDTDSLQSTLFPVVTFALEDDRMSPGNEAGRKFFISLSRLVMRLERDSLLINRVLKASKDQILSSLNMECHAYQQRDTLNSKRRLKDLEDTQQKFWKYIHFIYSTQI